MRGGVGAIYWEEEMLELQAYPRTSSKITENCTKVPEFPAKNTVLFYLVILIYFSQFTINF